jgi:hypothetical protein
MTTRFENGIVVTLGEKNRVLWNATVVTDGELVAAVGDSAEMKHRYPDAKSVDCSGKIILPGFHLRAPPLLLDHGTRHGYSRRTGEEFRRNPRKTVVEG